ncbi:MAG: hypothetical protein ACREF9_00020 [Opitutaceae bacterium]
MKFELNTTFRSADPLADVDPGLEPGAYTFQLIVVNDRGQPSKPAEAVVTINKRVVTPPVVLNPDIIVPVRPVIQPRPP